LECGYGAEELNELSEYRDLYFDFISTRQLPDDIEEWPEADQEEFYALSDELSAKYRKAEEERLARPLDEQMPEGFYILNITLETDDGPIYQKVDIRTLPLEKLSKLCSAHPQFNDYYFKKALNIQ
jgi:hypothetical protein